MTSLAQIITLLKRFTKKILLTGLSHQRHEFHRKIIMHFVISYSYIFCPKYIKLYMN